MRLLVCDTSNSNCSAGIFEDGKEICYELSFETLTHSETFMPLVHRVMEKAGVKHEDLDGYAVTVGPGSFTGIRIGVAAVKGMALAAGKKCIAVSSTEALARSCENATMTPKNETLIVPAIDARNNRVFACAAEDDKAGYGLNIYYAPGAAIMPKGVAAAAFAGKELIDGRDLKASYCAVSQAERLKKNG